ncbi:hypothetical protein JCM8097_001291 [Rhodosporidiobolus ruineniae]
MPVRPAPTTVSLITTTEEFRQLAGPEVASFQFAPPNSSTSTLYVELSMNWDSEVLWVKAERCPPNSPPCPPSLPVPPVKLAHAVEVASSSSSSSSSSFVVVESLETTDADLDAERSLDKLGLCTTA